MKKLLFVFLIVFILGATQSFSEGGWLIFKKPAYKGKVIDAETKEPIEGAVVVVVYQKYSLIGGPGGGYSSIVKVKETLTDKKGEFLFPAYTTIIWPLSREHWSTFIFYKPGYKSLPTFNTDTGEQLSFLPLNIVEVYFSKGPIGKEGELEERDLAHGEIIKIHKVTFGIVELPKAKTWEERLRARRVTITNYSSKELPLLYELINEEERSLGLEESK